MFQSTHLMVGTRLFFIKNCQTTSQNPIVQDSKMLRTQRNTSSKKQTIPRISTRAQFLSGCCVCLCIVGQGWILPVNFIDVLVAMRKIHPLSVQPRVFGDFHRRGSSMAATAVSVTGLLPARMGVDKKSSPTELFTCFFFSFLMISRSHGLQTVALKTRLAHSIRRPWGACWMVSVGGERENPLPFSLTASKRGRGWGGRGCIAASFPSRSPPPRQPFRALVVAMSS